MTEAVHLDPATCKMSIRLDPETITFDEFRTMRERIVAQRDYADDYEVNSVPYPDYATAIRAVVALLQPRIEAAQQRQEEHRTAWQRANPELIDVVDLVPTRWLARLKGNELRGDIDTLITDIRARGIQSPVKIVVGKKDRYARIGEGNHRIEAALRLNIEVVPAMVIVQNHAKDGQQFSHDVAEDLLIPADDYVPAEMPPSKVFRSLARAE